MQDKPPSTMPFACKSKNVIVLRLLGDVLYNPKTDLLGDDIPMNIQLQWHANYSYPCSQCLSVIRCLQCLVTDVHCYHTEVLRDCHYMWCYSDDVCHMTAP